ncbi:MAG: formate dehydrogenase subunit delta [Alphaproteobacteria bacterium]|nr:formate dehydrogenase subunit delta [Alphaproteobacteria bacterium]
MSSRAVMSEDRMLHKANQIALNFAPYPQAQAVEKIADHLRKFWTPPMREQLTAYVNSGREGLHALAVEAVKNL